MYTHACTHSHTHTQYTLDSKKAEKAVAAARKKECYMIGEHRKRRENDVRQEKNAINVKKKQKSFCIP